jgi:hypothetical protein
MDCSLPGRSYSQLLGLGHLSYASSLASYPLDELSISDIARLDAPRRFDDLEVIHRLGEGEGN